MANVKDSPMDIVVIEKSENFFIAGTAVGDQEAVIDPKRYRLQPVSLT
jgi:hypothetical protein